MRYISPKNRKDIALALKQGQVIAYPTQSSYGLGCLFSKTKSIARVYDIKQRPKKKNFIILARDIRMVRAYAHVNALAFFLFETCKDDPITLVLKAKKSSSFFEKTIAIRISSYPFISRLFTYIHEPIISTSLNRSGRPAIYSKSGLYKQFGKNPSGIDIFVDAGTLPINRPSMIIDVTQKPRIIRHYSKTLTARVKKSLGIY